MEQQKLPPVQPQSSADFASPLDDARKEIVRLKLAVADLKRNNQIKTDVRVLDLQLRDRNYRSFIERHGLTADFNKLYPY